MSAHPGINEEGGAQVLVPEGPPSASLPLRLTPAALLGSRRARRIVERNMTVYRRGWIYLVTGFFEPFFYLLSIGIGLNVLVGPLHLPGVAHPIPYTDFVAPGLLASAAMNGAIFDATFNIFFKLKIAHTYDAILSTPLGVGDVALGELSWSLMRGALYTGAFLCVMAGLGYVISPWAVLCFPGAVLITFAFAGAGMAGTTFMRSWQDFDLVSLAIIPLFLFSATFYPLSVYPGWLQILVRCTPLYQGVALLRGFDLGIFTWALLGHVAYLGVMGVVGLVVTARRLATLLLP
jgi:lipooligosaccharide transport system permease protein